jgi:hypothetical protein
MFQIRTCTSKPLEGQVFRLVGAHEDLYEYEGKRPS